MNLDPWDVVGSAEMTEHWRSVIPAISVEPVGGHGDVANDHGRASRVRQRYVLELKHLTETQRSRGFVSTGLTRISDWSPLTDEERITTRPGSPFALCRGIPSGLSSEVAPGSSDGRDFAILVSVPPPFLPAGPLRLNGVPLVIRRLRPFRPLPGDADKLWPLEQTIPSYE
ncbi:MAG: hypothetical protein M3065_14690 [Actinomycetota bacterium]|nr:hypothetical protein [Actinomycetota bacterium]